MPVTQEVGVVTLTHRVMLVDDSEADLLFTSIMLRRSGADFDVQCFESPREALRQLEVDPGSVDLILLDVNMPGMNGFDFLDAYERLMRERDVVPVVVMLTSSPDPVDRERASAFSCVKGYVTKPIDLPSARGLAQIIDSHVRP